MKLFKSSIEKNTLKNKYVRGEQYLNKFLQIETVNLKPGEKIGSEVSNNVIQLFHIESGEGKYILNGIELPVQKGDEIVAPAGSYIVNTGSTGDLKMHTLHTPPEYTKGIQPS